MLPKVSAALSKFISPVASSTNSNELRRDLEKDPQRRRGQSKREQPEQKTAPSAETFQRAIVERVTPTPSNKEDKPGEPQPHSPLTPGQTLLQLMASLRLTKGISKIFVALAYRSSSRAQKASGRTRKGAVLDHKAE